MDNRYFEQKFLETRKRQIDLHGRELTELDLQVSNVMFKTVTKAVEQVRSGSRRTCMQAVSLSTGLGKSSSAYALIATLVQEDPQFTAAYVVPTARMGMEAQNGIEQLLGEGKTFLWTSYHKHKGVDRKRALDELGFVPSRTANKADLSQERVVIVTHSQLQHELKSGRNEGTLHYQGKPRSVVFIDEHPDLVEMVEATPKQLQAFHDHLVKFSPQHPWLPVVSKVVARMSEVQREQGREQQYICRELLSLEQGRVFDNDGGLNLWELTDEELSLPDRQDEHRVMREAVAFLRAASKGTAFYSRGDYTFFAYQLYFPSDYPGFVLLDATSDLAGLVALHPAVEFADVPRVSYENLDLYHVAMPMAFRRHQKVIKDRRVGREYGEFITRTVLANSSPADEVLVVVHKDVLTQELIGASENPGEPLNWEGRRVNTQNWGAGVGLNKFKHKTHVFLFGDYVLPRTALIARTHGWSQRPLDEKELRLAEGKRWLEDVYSPQGAYRGPHEGHILRWTKQLAMRGCARQIDGEGRCLPMKLFTTMEPRRLVPNLSRLFPGAKAPVPANPVWDEDARPMRGRKALAKLLIETRYSSIIGADEVEVVTGIPQSKLSREFEALEEDMQMFGWSIKGAGELNRPGRMKYLVNESRLSRSLLGIN
jgi:hypothetical protein